MLSKVIKVIKLRLAKSHSWEYYKTILLYDFPADVKKKGEFLYLQKLGIVLEPGQGMPLLENYRTAIQLADNLGASFRYEGSMLIISFGQYTFQVQTAEDIFILNEVYAEGTYNFLPAANCSSLTVIDIGMNVGFASVFFATHKNVSMVYSFEPFTPTYNQALKHLALNNVQDRVNAVNFGLGGSDRELEVDYTPEFRGQVGIHGTGLVRSEVKGAVKEKIIIREINAELNKIITDNPEASLVFKIDCEGAEYEIMEKLPEQVFTQAKIMMIEWHEKGPSLLVDRLRFHGFTCFSFNPISQKVGMIYAVKEL